MAQRLGKDREARAITECRWRVKETSIGVGTDRMLLLDRTIRKRRVHPKSLGHASSNVARYST